MADRNSAAIFGMVFAHLAQVVNDYDESGATKRTACRLARNFWREMGNYDFSCSQLECDDGLVLLGLAREDDDGIEYAPLDLEGWT